MKIAILTQPLRYNYGGIIQNYALQTLLKRGGHEVYTIDRHNDKSPVALFFYRLWLFVKVRMLRRRAPITPSESRREFLHKTQHLQAFIGKHISTTEYISHQKHLATLLREPWDCFVVGSDQVWLKKFKATTFFDWVPASHPARRCAYAASIGASRWRFSPALTAQCRALAEQFHLLSVREKSAVALCREHLGVTPHHVLDPTMLLTAEDYNTLLTSTPPAQEGRILMTYILDKSPETERIIAQIARERGLTVVDYALQTGEVVPPIERWLSGFRDADYVVTDSFHGTVFSILYHKPFTTLLNARRGSDRFTSLLGLLRLEERLLIAGEGVATLPTEEIDFARVEARLEEQRAASLGVLRQITE